MRTVDKSALIRKSLVALFVISAVPVFGHSLPPLPTRELLAQVWLARSNDGIDMARLELSPQGIGTLVISFSPSSPPRAYRVAAVALKDWNVRLTLVALDPDPDGIVVAGSATPYQLDLEIRGTAGTAVGVVSRLRFEPYDRVMRSLGAVNARAAAIKLPGVRAQRPNSR